MDKQAKGDIQNRSESETYREKEEVTMKPFKRTLKDPIVEIKTVQGFQGGEYTYLSQMIALTRSGRILKRALADHGYWEECTPDEDLLTTEIECGNLS